MVFFYFLKILLYFKNINFCSLPLSNVIKHRDLWDFVSLFCCFLEIKVFFVKDFRNNELMIELLTGLPLVVAFFLDQWFHRGVPLWILYSLFCVQAGDSWSSQYLLVFRLHLHHCVSFLLVDWWAIGSFLLSIYLHLSIQFIHIYLFNIFTFIHYACVQAKENVNWKKKNYAQNLFRILNSTKIHMLIFFFWLFSRYNWFLCLFLVCHQDLRSRQSRLKT